MPTITAFSGSLRENSYNSALLKNAAHLMPEDSKLEIISIAEIPLYNGDDEESTGIPAVVEACKNKIATSDALLIATPEYNNSIPGVLKNALDWMTRPPEDLKRVFHNRIIGVIGATPGGFGTVHAQSAWLPIYRTLKLRPFFAKTLYLSAANKVFNKQGELIDDKIQANLKSYLDEFLLFVKKYKL